MSASHPWHKVNKGPKVPEIVNAIIEIPKGTRAKYEIDKETGLLKLDRVIFSSMYYPANYGFIPQSYYDDKDPLDILVLSQIDIEPLCIVAAKVIGVMRMIDSDQADDKIIAVAVGDPSVSHINDISELPQHFISELRNFFEDYKKLENKVVTVADFLGHAVAQEKISHSFELYDKEIRPSIKY